MEALAGESIARNKYTYFASAAKKEGYEQISAIFTQTADNEKEHAKLGLKSWAFRGYQSQFEAAAQGEHYEWTDMYKRMSEEAKEEGFLALSDRFARIATIEKTHEERYHALLNNLNAGVVFKKDAPTVWVCRNCGYKMTTAEAPKECPACAHPQAYFELDCQTTKSELLYSRCLQSAAIFFSFTKEESYMTHNKDHKENQELEVIAILENNIEADLLSACLDEEKIPHLIRDFTSDAYGPMFVMNWGWGQVLSGKEYGQKILAIFR